MEKVKSNLKCFVSSPILFLFLIGLYPVVFLTSKNWFVYEAKQLLFLLVIPVITGVVGLIITGVSRIMRIIILNKFSDRFKRFIYKYFDSLGVGRIILCLIGFFIFYILLEASIPNSRKVMVGLVTCVVFACFLVSKFRFYYINITLLVMILLATGELAYSLSTKSIGNETLVERVDKELDNEVIFKKTPNIYLIHLEAYQSPVAMRRLYDIDNQNFVNELNNLGFFVSENNFSNYISTLQSVGSIFIEDHHYYKVASGQEDAVGMRDLVGGRLYNPTLSILKNNGYKIVYLQLNTYSFMGSDYLDYYYPHNSLHDSLLIFQSDKINQIRAKIFGLAKPSRKNTNSAGKNEYAGILWDYLEKGPSPTQPSFYYIRNAGAVHTPADGSYSWKNESEDWVFNRYNKAVEKANPEILKMVLKIISKDPNGVIVLYGDHGAWKYRSIWAGDKKDTDLNKLIYDRKKIGGEDLALDLFGTFLAVRYPEGNNKLLDGETHVNIFRILFSDLSESNILLKNKPANNSYLKFRGVLYLLVKDGKALEKIETVGIPD